MQVVFQFNTPFLNYLYPATIILNIHFDLKILSWIISWGYNYSSFPVNLLNCICEIKSLKSHLNQKTTTSILPDSIRINHNNCKSPIISYTTFTKRADLLALSVQSGTSVQFATRQFKIDSLLFSNVLVILLKKIIPSHYIWITRVTGLWTKEE